MTSIRHNDAANEAAALAHAGAVAEGYHLLEQAIAAGDGMAAATLAQWRLSGQYIRRDLAVARDLYGRAAAAGIGAAAPIHIAMLACGAGGAPRDWSGALGLLAARAGSDPWAARQQQLVGAMDLTAQGDPIALPPLRRQRTSPVIAIATGVLTTAECRYLIDRASDMLQPSVVVHPQMGTLVRDPVRTAKSAGFPFVLEDPVLHAINRRIAALTGTTYEQGEPLQVLRYDPGDAYKLHSDALPPGENQRITTCLVTLNNGFTGGDTEFPRLPYRWRGRPGDALCFANVEPSGAPEFLSWHAGAPVQRGTKFLLSKWIRQHPLDLSGPPGRPF